MSSSARGARSDLPLRARPLDLAGRIPVIAALTLLVLVAIAFRWWAERRIVGPWYLDEFRYAESAREIAGDWSNLVRGFAKYYYLYPRLIAPAWAADPMSTTYAVAKAINVVLITSAAVPIFLWARRVLRPWPSVLVVALAFALPAGLYSGLLVTENAFFPAFALAAFLLAWALERPTPVRQVLAVAAVVLACAIRLQALVFLAIIPSAVVLKAAFDARQAREPFSMRRFAAHVRPYLLLLGLLAAGLALYALRQLLAGEKLSGGVGVYGAAVDVHNYSAAHVLKWIVYHFAGIALAVAVVPFSALVLLTAEAWRREARMTAAERALVAVVASAVFWVVVQAGVLASGRWAERMTERYMIYGEVLLLLALVVWVNRGAPRPWRALVVALAAPVALVLTLPLEWLLGHPAIYSDAFSLVALHRWSQHVGGAHNLWLVLAFVTVAVAVAVAVVPRRIIVVLAPSLVLAYLVAASLSVPAPLRAFARGLRAGAQIGDNAGWIDRFAGSRPRVDVLYTGSPEGERVQMTILQMQFWNRSVRTVDRLAPIEVCCVPQRDASTDLSTGMIRPVGPPATPATYVVPVPPVDLEGARIAEQNGMTLFHNARRLRLLSTTAGVYSDGWMGADATYDHFGPGSRRSRVRVVVSRASWKGPDKPSAVRVEVGSLAAFRGPPALEHVFARRVWTVHSGSARTFVLPTPPPPYRVAVHIAPTFSPSDYGLADTRRLGAQVSFSPA